MTARDDYPMLVEIERSPLIDHPVGFQAGNALAEIEHLRAEVAALSASLRFPKGWTQSRAAAELERLRALEAAGGGDDDSYAAGWNACLEAVSMTVPVRVMVGLEGSESRSLYCSSCGQPGGPSCYIENAAAAGGEP